MIQGTITKRANAIVGLVCLIATILGAQVHIREKVLITPSPTTAPTSLGGDGTASMRAVLSVDNPIFLRMYVTRDCGGPINNDLPFEGTSQVEFALTQSTIGGYYFNLQPRVADIPVGVTVTASFDLYTGGVLAFHSEETFSGGGTGVFAVWMPKDQFYPYAFGFGMFPLASCIATGEYATIALPMNAFCSQSILWSPERDPITFEITEGVELGELQDHTGQSLGSQVTLKWEDAINLRFAAGENLPNGGNVQISATAGDVMRTTTLGVFLQGEYDLYLEANDSQVQHGEQVELFGSASACDGTGVAPPPGTTYTFTITQGNQWGRLYSEDTNETGDVLTDVPQSGGFARVWFQAWEDSPTENQTVVVELSAEGRPAVTATLEVTPGGLVIVANPSNMRFGDKSSLDVRRLLPDGTTEPLTLDDLVTYRIVGGEFAGTLQNTDSTEWGDELFLGGDEQIKFASLEEEPQPDIVEVIIQVEVSSGIIISSRVKNPPPVLGGKGSSHPNPVDGSASSLSFFDGLSGVARVAVRKHIFGFCQGDYPNARYDNYKIKGKDGKDSLDALGEKVYYSVANKGCALTCMAIIAKAGGADIDPETLAAYMRDPTSYGFEGHIVRWRSIDDLTDNSGYAYSKGSGKGLKYKDKKIIDLPNSLVEPLTNMDQYLNDQHLIVAQVYNASTEGEHWVVVDGKEGSSYSIVDPGCYLGRTTLQNGYNDTIYKFVVYKKKANQS